LIIELEGYLLPKGSVVFMNLFDAHHDEEYWKEPEVFLPERFLDETETKLVKHDALMPFSFGISLFHDISSFT
jgi:cytochrome P450